MSEMNISLKGPEDALEFVRRVEKYPYTMDLCCGSIVVDCLLYTSPSPRDTR